MRLPRPPRRKDRTTNPLPGAVVTTETDGTLTVRSGELLRTQATALAAAARRRLAGGDRAITIDLTAVTHINADGSDELLHLARDIGRSGATMTIVVDPGQPYHRLRNAGLGALRGVEIVPPTLN
ncbi:STAS domain-containing protein (plasmid) [Streptomycetaceae bacterium NBC_01309]